MITGQPPLLSLHFPLPSQCHKARDVVCVQLTVVSAHTNAYRPNHTYVLKLSYRPTYTYYRPTIPQSAKLAHTVRNAYLLGGWEVGETEDEGVHVSHQREGVERGRAACLGNQRPTGIHSWLEPQAKEWEMHEQLVQLPVTDLHKIHCT